MRSFIQISLCLTAALLTTLPATAARGPKGSTLLAQSTEAPAEAEVAPAQSPDSAAAPATAPQPAAPVAAATPEPPAKKAPAKVGEDKFTEELRKVCERHYPGRIQGELRTACTSPADGFSRHGKGLSQVRCRLNYGEEPRLVMACQVGVTIADDLSAKRDDYKKKHQLCAEHYPQHTEIDAFLQESCLTGIHLSEVMTVTDSSKAQTCSQITPERSFIGPCSVGLSLAQDMSNPAAPSQQNKLCEQYFDHARFHLTYRACLNARSVAVDSARAEDVIKNCANVMSNNDNDNERAACIVGSSIHRSLVRKEDVAKRFQKCGDSKVSYQERDVLACLTAASLRDYADKNGAENACKEVYKSAKSGSRSACVSSVSLF